MADNLKLIEERIDIEIDPTGAPGSILAENHNGIEKEILRKSGKYTGSPFVAKKESTLFPSGTLSWNGNAMNNVSNFLITTSKLTSDLTDFGKLLSTMATGDLIQFKDYSGRSVFLEFQSYQSNFDGSMNPIYEITVKGFSDNLNYIYQVNESSFAVLSLIKKIVDLSLLVSKLERLTVSINNVENVIELNGERHFVEFQNNSQGFFDYFILSPNYIGGQNHPLQFRNATNSPIVLKNMISSGTSIVGETPLFFPNGLNLILEPNETVQFCYNSDNNRFDYVGVSFQTEISDVNGLQDELDLKASKTYVDGLVVGLLDDRGNYDASTNLFPSTGGSGTSGEVLKGDIWYISISGTLGGKLVNVGDSVRALTDAPGQTSGNWDILESNIGYVPENTANKSTDVEADKTSNIKFATVKSIYDWAVGKFQSLLVSGVNIKTLNNQPILGSGNIDISTESKIAFTVFVNTLTGNDATGQIEFQSKPFLTELGAFNAIPSSIDLWTIQFIDGNVTRQVTSAFRTKNVIYKTNFGGIINFNSSCFVGPQFNRYPPLDGNPIRIEAPLAHAIFSVDNVRLGCTSENFSIIVRELTLNGNMQIKSTSLIASKITCDILNTNMTATDYGFFNATATVVKVGTWNLTKFRYGSDMTDEQSLISSFEVVSLNLIGGDLKRLFASGTIGTFRLGNVTGSGQIRLTEGKATASPLRRSEIFFNNSFVSSNCTVIIQFFETTNLFISGNIVSDFENIDIGSADGPGNEYNFLNFNGRLIPQNARYFNITAKLTMQNSSIKVSNYFFSWRDRIGNIPTVGGFTSFKLIGYNTIVSDNPSTNNLIEYQIDPLTVINEGTLKTNFTSFGKNIIENNITVTSKEKLKEKVIRSKIDLINRVLDSNTTYIIDGNITLLSGEFINVPATGLTIVGYGFNVSIITKNISGQSIFSSPTGGSGDFISNNIQYNSGLGSVFNLLDSNGTHAIEMNDVNFQSCTSLGTLNGYRQFTGTTIGIYGCSDGFSLEGNWTGFKLVNTNAFGFGASGTLIKKGTTTSFSNRLYLDLNLILPTGAKICDFQDLNFASDKLLQIVNCLVKVNGVIDPNTTATTFPNITPFSPKSYFTNNIGIKNSFNEPYGLKTTNLSTYSNDISAGSGGIQVGEVYIESTTGYFKTRLT